MASARFAWGIDVGNRALKAVKLVRDGDGYRVDDFELIEHENVLSNAGDNRDSLVQTSLANFVQRHPNLKGGVAAVGVSGQSSFARFIKLPPVEPKKIPEIVKFEAIQQIPFPLDDVEWSYQLFQSPDTPDVEVGIFAMRKELVNRHIGFFTDFDLNVQVVQMNPLAVYNAMNHDGRLNDGTTMIIDMGAENTDLIIADNDTIWMRTIPIGGNNFTETLVKGFKLPFAKAEELKRNAQSSKYARQIFQAMRPIFADLVAEIQRSIGFYSSVHRDSRIKKIIALGGTFKLPGLQKYLQQNLSLDVEKLDNIAAGAPTDTKLAATFNENLLSVMGAYGLALQGMGEGKITSSLLPAAIKREKAWKEKTPLFGAAAALFVAGAVIAGGRWFLQDVSLRDSMAAHESTINSTKTKAEQLDQKWATIAGSGEAERTLIHNVDALSDYRLFWHNALLDIFDKALPKPEPAALADGLAKGDKALITQTPRGQRSIFTVDSLRTRYLPDGTAILSLPESDFKRYAADNAATGVPAAPAAVEGAPPPAADANATNGINVAGLRGFLVTAQMLSPHDAAPSVLVTKVLPNLLAIKPTEANPHPKYAVARAVIVNAQRVKSEPNRLTKMKLEYDNAQKLKAGIIGLPAGGGGGEGQGFNQPGGGFNAGGFQAGGGFGTAGGSAGAAGVPLDKDESYFDPITGETMVNDWEFTILFAIVVEPPAYTAPAPGAAGEQPATQPTPAPQASAAPTP